MPVIIVTTFCQSLSVQADDALWCCLHDHGSLPTATGRKSFWLPDAWSVAGRQICYRYMPFRHHTEKEPTDAAPSGDIVMKFYI